MATKAMMDSRTSTETDRRHLLSSSVVPSESASMITDYEDGDRTPRARSPIRTTTRTTDLYRGFQSEAEYFAALEQWAESKKYLDPETKLVGYYGEKTMDHYASQPGVELGLMKKWRERKQKKAERREKRRNTVA